MPIDVDCQREGDIEALPDFKLSRGATLNGVAAAHNDMDKINEALISLLNYCKKHDWAGFDPYDALNSRLFARTPFMRSRVFRIALIQSMKRLPVNLRPLLLISEEQNPKAIAIFLKAFLKLSRLGLPEGEELTGKMVERLIALRSQNTPYWCWGYSFPWQTRTNLVPYGAPNLVCTTFVADALLDAYEKNHEARCLEMAVSSGEYMLNELYWTDGDAVAGFSYPLPLLRARVHNANFLGAALFCRIYKNTGQQKFLDTALKIARYSAGRQSHDGSWVYGELPTQRWVDNFHTGYNLGALRSICQYTGMSEFEPHIRRGIEFYRKHFFREDGAPKYFHDRVYPLDIHSVAQSIITLLEFRDLDESNCTQAVAVFEWAQKNLRDKQGYFYYQKYPYFTNKISYMRWSQAWMLLALATLREECDEEARASAQARAAR